MFEPLASSITMDVLFAPIFAVTPVEADLLLIASRSEVRSIAPLASVEMATPVPMEVPLIEKLTVPAAAAPPVNDRVACVLAVAATPVIDWAALTAAASDSADWPAAPVICALPALPVMTMFCAPTPVAAAEARVDCL